MLRLATLLCLLAAPLRADCVVVLHGLSRSEYSMLLLQEVLALHGYQVVNRSYPSETARIEDLVAHVGLSAADCQSQPTHFVTHSLGGILARAWLADQRPAQMGRVVMLAPPNQGTEIVDQLASTEVAAALMDLFHGPVVRELGTGAGSVPARLGPVDFDLGVIAGNRAFSPLGPILIDGPNDGTVSVASTRVDGMADHIVLPTSHTLIMNNPLVLAQVLAFLRDGRFQPEMDLRTALTLLAEP